MCDCFEGRRQWAKQAVPDIVLYKNYQELLADKNVDAVFIGTSDHGHAPIGIAAAQAGKHLYSEKTLANSFEECVAYRAAV
jgi:predicted dehydrogenase